MEQLSDEDLDHTDGGEEDSDKEDQDLDKMFGAWLGELDKLTQSLDDGRPETVQKAPQKAPLRQETNMANFCNRFSMYNINEALNKGGEGVDLDSLMADLCSIEQELSTIGKPNSGKNRLGVPGDAKLRQKPPAGRGTKGTRASPASTVAARRPLASNLDDITAQLEQASLSMDEAGRQSSHSLASGSTSSSSTMRRPASHHHTHRRTGSVGTVSEHAVRSISQSSWSSVNSASASSMDSLDSYLRPSEQDGATPTPQGSNQGPPGSTEEEQVAKKKAEKIRVALEKIKEAQVKKLVIRVHLSDESSKTMMVDERQTVRQVLDSLLDKSHCGYSPDWSLVETINELQMERIFEDHENLVDSLLNWTRDSQNRLMFIERIEKYALFKNPQNYLLGRKETCEMADRNKEALLEECFCGSSVSVPEMEGVLWLKEDGKKSWKKRYFLLRASGIYYVPKGKAKASRDLVCFLQLDHVNVYYGQDYRSKYKAPTDYCLALKHPQIQKKSQYIKYLCCDDVRTLHQWINGIRIAKYGKTLYVNYQEAMKRTEAAYDWSSLSSSSIKSGSSSSSLPESQSTHCSSDSGVAVSENNLSGHSRSQSQVSSIFSEAWKRGTQDEVPPVLTPSPYPQFLAQKFPNMNYDFSDLDGQPVSPPPPALSPPMSPPAPPRTFSGVFPPQTAPKTFGPGIPLSPVSPSPPSGPMKKQQSFSTGHSPNQPPPTMPKQHSFSSKTLPLSAPISPTPSLVKQIVNQFPGAPLPPQSPPAVKTKPRWQPGGQIPPQSPEFPPPPPEDSLDFPPPPHSIPTPAPPPLSPAKMGSPIKKSPSSTSTSSFGKRGPPPTPQRASSIKSNSSGEYQEEAQVQRQPKKVESLVSKFAQPGLGSCNSSAASSSGSPAKDLGPPAPPKPGKLNLSALPLVLQGLQTGQHCQPSGDFPSPPSELDYFPPPPPDSELLPPPPLLSELHPGAPRVAVVNPQPQSSWKTQSLKKTPPPTLHRLSRSNTVQDPLPLSPPPFACPLPPTSPGVPKGGGTLSSVQPNFLEDLNRTLKRKSITRHGSLTRHGSSRLEPVSMDDMALPPPPPELLLDQQRGGQGGGHGYMSSGYATLRRGPRPAPPKRDQNTKLTGEW
uniref:Ras association (RalGDS/AF-6) and pleckstrin homology domains 1 n=1 Tax=Oncorhynchus kisutch TaxID=8019 RepID=A0A8C7CFU9_ONCKI